MNTLDRKRQTLAIALAALAGFIDAVGYLSADGYFVSFMSGNTTRLGVNIAGAPQLALFPASLIGGFVCGVTLGAYVSGRAGARRKPAVLAVVSLLLVGAALAHTMGGQPAVLALLVTAMGAINNTFQRGGEVSVGLTYMTGALVKLGQTLGARLLGERRTGQQAGGIAWLLLWCGLAGGAVLGALAFTHVAGLALWLGAAWALMMTAAASRLPA